ncbi:Osmotically-inducible protein OsmY, contains BON domain [Hymenobacter daecheongensis DSM 21074]|uniref:Osmotically-inducible protein OsmY, contains BON domain n=1 Tax=Hymenobacter daecheongensis DSM 21074 TaxID=1121955 RepID=A0A1M6MDL9_9BACT|nr:BON domain-containing protein [Hymenobacter daecheongensis]SHJ81551.1 Osmotically-inducible protein OsmY, contains BON domain [Hymenobacter daecheongensis DSM 21074]
METAETLTETLPQLSDEAITTAIERLFALKHGVSAAWIDVATTEGIVTLTGFTDNLLSLSRAEEIAKAVRGVRGVVNELEIRTPEIPDAQLLLDLEEALAADAATHAYALVCHVREGEAELRGTVRNWAERQLALRVASGVRGIRRLTDHLLYAAPATPCPDAELTTQIRELLRWNVRVHAGLVQVAAQDGHVQLSGIVGSAAERSEVVATAWAAGASQVAAQELRVEPGVPWEELRQDKYDYHPDADIAQAIRATFKYDSRVVSFEPLVEVHNGVVTLRGIVSNLAARHAAGQDARNVVGVGLVHNLLKVRPVGLHEDPFIQTRVQGALFRDPYVGRFGVAVQVHGGVVSLSGSVHTHFQQAHAGQVAAGVSGVVQVDNHLQVPTAAALFREPTDAPPAASGSQDQALEQAIRQELYWNAFLHGQHLRVTVKNAQATLRGTVDTWQQAQMATHCALTVGASTIVNKLRTRAEMPL